MTVLSRECSLNISNEDNFGGDILVIVKVESAASDDFLRAASVKMRRTQFSSRISNRKLEIFNKNHFRRLGKVRFIFFSGQKCI